MAKINKIDFFVGAFLTEILSSNKTKTIPALFAGDQNESKGIKFETNKGTLNIYIKYSMKRDEKTWDKGKGAKGKKYTCNILFSDSEYDKLVNSVAYQNLSHIVIVWTTEELKDTWLVVLGYDDAMKCLKNKTETGSRRITVTRYGSAREFICKGVGFAEDESVMCSFDHTTAF